MLWKNHNMDIRSYFSISQNVNDFLWDKKMKWLKKFPSLNKYKLAFHNMNKDFMNILHMNGLGCNLKNLIQI
jgi:hypothetical protein